MLALVEHLTGHPRRRHCWARRGRHL